MWQLHLCIKDLKPEKDKSRPTQQTVCVEVTPTLKSLLLRPSAASISMTGRGVVDG